MGLEPPTTQRRRTSRRVLVVDAVAGVVVRAGGLLVIVAVLGILVFLVATVAPLFRDGVFGSRDAATEAGPLGRVAVPVEGAVGVLAVDEYRLLAVAVGARPEAVCFRPDTGEVVARVPVPDLGEGNGSEVVAAGRSVRAGEAVLAGANGRLAFLDLGFESDFVLGAEGDALRETMRAGEVRVVAGTVVQRVAGGNLRRVTPKVAVRGSVALPPGAGRVLAVGYATSGETGAAVAVTSDRQVHVVREAVTTTLLGAVERAWTAAPPVEGAPAPPEEPFAALVDEEVRAAWVLGRRGGFLRIDLTVDPPRARETGLLLDEPDASRLTAAAFVLGDRSLVACDDRGGASVWSLVPVPGAASGDGRETRRIHRFPEFSSAVVALATGSTRRTVYFGHADGAVTAAYVTNERVLARVAAFDAGPIAALAAPSKDDGLLVVGPESEARSFDFDCPHPEASLGALFSKVHYEGYLEPSYLYQSTSGTDEAETKLSLVPLLFGTLKGTFYALLFALPLALLAALYTSQFMHPRVRAFVKPSVEVMASLPSVVLGFLAALVIAPFVAGVLPGLFLGVLAVPVVGSVAGVLWHAAPLGLRRRVGSGARLTLALALVAGTVTLAWRSNGAIQRALFSGPSNSAGDFQAWCRAGPGSGSGVPILVVGLFLLGACVGPLVVPRFLRLDAPRGVGARDRLGVVGRGVLKAVAYAVAPGILLAALAVPLEGLLFGGDFRRFLLGPDGEIVEQLNCLVLGIAMGFAVIPIVYTITEDALSSIPESLRSASLACGASPWQTALRVVVPAAVPGIFSAVMIGLGRAVGETMIVLMATGGTAIMDVSPFNGFRSLSANIATEMPEAPQGGTLYRVLFLAGLLLFALTFVVNTLAEIVRIRFRRRFKGL